MGSNDSSTTPVAGTQPSGTGTNLGSDLTEKRVARWNS